MSADNASSYITVRLVKEMLHMGSKICARSCVDVVRKNLRKTEDLDNCNSA